MQRVTVIVVNWNGRDQLKACLESLGLQSYEAFDVIVIDNGSSDGSVSMIKEQFESCELIALDENLGFAAGVNLGIQVTESEFIALLNNDAIADPHWLEALVTTLMDHPSAGSCASKIVFQNNPSLADSCGDFYSIEGIPGKTGHLEPEEKYQEQTSVFAACAGAAIYRRSMLDEVGLFDEDFYMVHEDTDIGFRAQLKGFQCIYCPDALVFHRVSASLDRTPNLATHLAQRNMELTYIKNMPTVLIVLSLPLHIVANSILLIAYAFRGQLAIFLKAKADALRMAPVFIKKRKLVQSGRSASVTTIARRLKYDWFFSAVGKRFHQ